MSAVGGEVWELVTMGSKYLLMVSGLLVKITIRRPNCGELMPTR